MVTTSGGRVAAFAGGDVFFGGALVEVDVKGREESFGLLSERESTSRDNASGDSLLGAVEVCGSDMSREHEYEEKNRVGEVEEVVRSINRPFISPPVLSGPLVLFSTRAHTSAGTLIRLNSFSCYPLRHSVPPALLNSPLCLPISRLPPRDYPIAHRTLQASRGLSVLTITVRSPLGKSISRRESNQTHRSPFVRLSLDSDSPSHID